MKTILVTGANGQLGNELKQCKNEFPEFLFIFTDVEELDLTNKEAVEAFYSENKFDIIINCAAYTNVDKAETDKEKAFLINAEAVRNLSTLSVNKKLTLIHISTDYVFEGSSEKPYKEDDKTNPQSVYGETKLKGEEFAKMSYNYLIIRTSWLYSSFGNNFVKTMLRLGQERPEINVVSDQIGSPTYAYDLAFAILTILRKINSGKLENFSGIYHFSNEGFCSWYDFAIEIMKLAGLNCKVNPISTEFYPTPAKRPKYSLMDKSKIKEKFGIDILDWKISLEKCIQLLK